jgi:AcrR family transcriptional regulator
VRQLAQYLAPEFDTLSREQLLAMVVRASDRRAMPVGVRQLGEELGLPRTTVSRHFRSVRDRVAALENAATDRLVPLFVPELVSQFGT